jgi:hypothetical protein
MEGVKMILSGSRAELMAAKFITERADAIRAALPSYKKAEHKEWRVFWPATIMYYINAASGGNKFFAECRAAGVNSDANIIAMIRRLLIKNNLMEI